MLRGLADVEFQVGDRIMCPRNDSIHLHDAVIVSTNGYSEERESEWTYDSKRKPDDSNIFPIVIEYTTEI